MADIFISYAKEDKDEVRPLAKALEKLGWSVFWDVTIPVGKTWRQVIEDELRAAGCVLVVWSNRSIAKEWVLEEAVVGVNYFEAEAYAIWAEKRLPTEKEWERAARGTDGWEYPWGNAFAKEKCNTHHSYIRNTTDVMRYPNGISPIGCYDMAGNVWEWTESWWYERRDRKVIRGGSWKDDLTHALSSGRHRNIMYERTVNLGFRCIREI